MVKERAEKEAAQAAEVKKRAEEELDGFYDTRTDEVNNQTAVEMTMMMSDNFLLLFHWWSCCCCCY